MTQYTNESTLVLFKNDKGDNPKRPDYRGKLYLNGEEFKLSCWISEKKDGSGEKYLRGKVERAEAQGQRLPPAFGLSNEPKRHSSDIDF